MGDWRWETGDERKEMGDRRKEMGDRRKEMGDRRWETGDGRQEMEDRRWKTGDGRRKKIDRRGFSDVISEKFSAYINLAGEFISFKRTLIAKRKYKLAGAAKSAKWGKFFFAVFRQMKNLEVLAD